MASANGRLLPVLSKETPAPDVVLQWYGATVLPPTTHVPADAHADATRFFLQNYNAAHKTSTNATTHYQLPTDKVQKRTED